VFKQEDGVATGDEDQVGAGQRRRHVRLLRAFQIEALDVYPAGGQFSCHLIDPWCRGERIACGGYQCGSPWPARQLIEPTGNGAESLAAQKHADLGCGHSPTVPIHRCAAIVIFAGASTWRRGVAMDTACRT
jgi:hypothetical protein